MWFQRSVTLHEWGQWLAEVRNAKIWGTSKKEPQGPRVPIPTLKFTVPSKWASEKRRSIKLKDLQSSTRFGIKFVRSEDVPSATVRITPMPTTNCKPVMSVGFFLI
eukprot:symbB.v1.2.038780.t1/scaffold6170.1/size20375/2